MADYDAYLTADDERFAERDAALLRAVDDAGSLNAAADALGRSYAREHRRLAALEAAFGPLVERQRGGAGGGGSRLTDGARDLLAAFDRLRAGFDAVTGVEETVLAGRITDREGELATVDTAVGPVRALAPAGATDVDVTLRSDAVTLHAPDDSPPADATSARNRVPGTVAAVDRGEAVARVRVDVGADRPLLALVTAESVDRLELDSGRRVVASFKATATRATRR